MEHPIISCVLLFFISVYCFTLLMYPFSKDKIKAILEHQTNIMKGIAQQNEEKLKLMRKIETMLTIVISDDIMKGDKSNNA